MPILFILIAIVSIQTGASVAKGLFPIVGPEGATALRLGLASLILVCVWRPWRQRLSLLQLRDIALYGAALGAMNLLFYLALARIPLGIAVALEFTGPLTVALAFSRRPIDFVWAGLAVAGIALILPYSGVSASLDLVGMLEALLAGASWALYILAGKKAGDAADSGTVTSIGMVTAFLLTLPFGIARAGAELLRLSTLPLGLGVALLSSAIPYSFEMAALKRLPHNTFSILMSMEPAVAAMSGMLLLGEQLSLRQWAAIGFIMAASVGSAMGNRGAVVAAWCE